MFILMNVNLIMSSNVISVVKITVNLNVKINMKVSIIMNSDRSSSRSVTLNGNNFTLLFT